MTYGDFFCAQQKRDFHLCYKQIRVRKYDYWFVNAFCWLSWILLRWCWWGIDEWAAWNTPRFSKFNKSPNRFFIAVNWYAECRNTLAHLISPPHCSRETSMHAEIFCGLSGGRKSTQKTINTVGASVNSLMIYFWWFRLMESAFVCRFKWESGAACV